MNGIGARRGHWTVGNFDIEVVCPGCGNPYPLLHRIVANGNQDLGRKSRSASLPLWQRCYHCGHMTDEGAKQAKARLANKLIGVPFGPFVHLTEEIVTAKNDAIKMTIMCLLASFLLYYLTVYFTAESWPGSLYDIVVMIILLLFVVGLGNLARIMITLPRYIYFTCFWNPQGRAQLEKWRSWWNADGNRIFLSRLQTHGEDDTWEPEVH